MALSLSHACSVSFSFSPCMEEHKNCKSNSENNCMFQTILIKRQQQQQQQHPFLGQTDRQTDGRTDNLVNR